jgi:predicted transcriptional regulator
MTDVSGSKLARVQQNDHLAAAAYLMKHAGVSALPIVDGEKNEPVGTITETDIARALAEGKDLNSVRIYQLTTSLGIDPLYGATP